MTTPTVTDRRHGQPQVGRRVELDRYTVPAGERILYGQRIDGIVRITDVPARPGGRAYLVERGLQNDGYAALLAIVQDYVREARRLGEIPVAEAVADRWLENLS